MVDPMNRNDSQTQSILSPARPRISRQCSVEQLKENLDAEDSDDDGVLSIGSAVQLYATGADPIYRQPWKVDEQENWTGSGVCTSGNRIITNAHCVANAIMIQIQRQDNPKKWRARATAVAHDLDLAVIEVDDADFWIDAVTADFAPADKPIELYTEVNAIGFPLGGSTLCVTKGVISRFDAHLYAHPGSLGVLEKSKNYHGPIFILQVDSAINPGNSGGPAVDRSGDVVGIASSGIDEAQNIGFVIPASIVHLFLDEVKTMGKWTGVSELGLWHRSLEADTYRLSIGMDSKATGVLVEEVAPLSALFEKVLPGDILTHIDGSSISNEGKVPISVSQQTVYVECGALVTCKPKGAPTKFGLLRKNDEGMLKQMTVIENMKPFPPLVPRYHKFDIVPEYVLVGGIVFSRASLPLAMSLEKFYGEDFRKCFYEYKKNESHEKVVVVDMLKHDINIGYSFKTDIKFLESVNGEVVRNLPHLASIITKLEAEKVVLDKSNDDKKFVKFYFQGPSKFPDIVLEKSKISKANREICKDHAIFNTISPSLLKS